MNLNDQIRKMSIAKKGCLFIVLAFATLVITSGILVYNSENKPPQKKWKEMNYDERKVWLEEYVQHPDDGGYQLISLMDKSIKKEFQFPEEVEYSFAGKPSFGNAIIGDADSSWVFVIGAGIGKNAFGVKKAFKYTCKLTINDSLRRLDKVSVTIDE